MKDSQNKFEFPCFPYSIQNKFQHNIPVETQGAIDSIYSKLGELDQPQSIRNGRDEKRKIILNSKRKNESELSKIDIMQFIIEKNKQTRSNRRINSVSLNNINNFINKADKISDPPKLTKKKLPQFSSKHNFSKSSQRSFKKDPDFSEGSIASEASIMEKTCDINVPNLKFQKLKIVRSKPELLNSNKEDKKEIKINSENQGNFKNIQKVSYNNANNLEAIEKYNSNNHPEIKILLTDYIEYIGSKISDSSQELKNSHSSIDEKQEEQTLCKTSGKKINVKQTDDNLF